MISKKNLLLIDFILIFLVFAISIFGIIIIGSATKINVSGGTGEFESQIIWFITGIFFMLAAAFIDYHFICKFYIPMYIINIILLVAVLFLGGGNGVNRWILGIQPSEFSKIFMILFLAKYVDKNQEEINKFKTLSVIFITTIIPTALIKAQPSLSASLVTLAIMIVILFVGNINKKYIFIALAIVAPIGAIFLIDLFSENHSILKLFLNDYHIDRILSAINPDESDPLYYQTKHSIWAIGSGALNGKGLYQGTINQLKYLPESHNDFIFSVVGEEFGFIGCISILALMLLIILRCLFIANRAIDNMGKLIVSGVAGMLAFQVLVNVGVATGLLPNTGMPFPFLSYGGSSMLVNMIAVGLVINVGLRKPKSMFER
ncbi:MAG: rod shape-determining protein RodA [Clostridiales bacterium]|nr:rod shape-determining protein RodA [Clostridiales bacterium]